ncbi:MAG: PD-(D/E)XK nuclease family protein [Oscillospiraceae bacterium]|nr:PD-(D/E)XK nuclease family protein [Oscillospiraceae bacterium]
MIRIIYGPARSGKTSRILREIREIAAAADGAFERRAILVVPDQYSHMAERQLLEVCGDGTSLSAEATSLKRLVTLAYGELGIANAAPAPGGKLLLLFRALEAVRGELSLYGSVMSADYLEPILRSIESLKRGGVSSEELLAFSRENGGLLSKKLGDLAVLRAAYDAECAAAGFRDDSDALRELAPLVWNTAIPRAKLYFDGFTDFTAPELELVKSLIGGADVTFCFTCDDSASGDDAFETARRTIRLLSDECRGRGIVCELICEPVSAAGGVTPRRPAKSVRVFAAPDRQSECEYAAALTLELVRSGLRFRDVAVLARADDGIGKTLERVFELYGIPSFRAAKSDVAAKPPVQAPLAALDAILRGYDTEAVLAYVKTGHAGLSFDETDALVRYAEQQRLYGGQWLREKPWAFSGDAEIDAELDAVRRRVAAPLRTLADGLRASALTGDKLRALYSFLEETALCDSVNAREESLRTLGETRLADEYSQLWELLVAALDEIDAAAGTLAVSDGEFRRLLTVVLSQYSVGVIPTSLDRTLVGEFTYSRRREIKALLVVEASDEQLPLPQSGEGVFSRAELEAAEARGISLGAAPEEYVFREDGTIFAALSLPRDSLYLIYPETARQSYVVTRLLAEYGLSPERLTPGRYLAAAPSPYRLLTRLALGGGGSPDVPDAISSGSATALYGEKLRLSPTGAEEFSLCAYKFFLNHGLRLRPETAVELDAPAAGSFMHFIMERVIRRIAGADGAAQISPDSAADAARDAAEEFFATQITAFGDRSERFRRLYGRLARDAELVASDMTAELRAGDFVPALFESAFEFEVSPALSVRGIADRIDVFDAGDRVFVRVTDYKSGKKKFSLSEVAAGLGLQPLVYLLALETLNVSDKPVIPAAALYAPARNEIPSLPRGSTEAEIQKELSSRLRRAGVVLRDDAVIEALENGENKRYLPLKSNETARAGSELLDGAQMNTLLGYTRRKLIGVSDGIAGGGVAPVPAARKNEPECAYCDFRAACVFGIRGDDKPRAVRRIADDEFWRSAESGASE